MLSLERAICPSPDPHESIPRPSWPTFKHPITLIPPIRPSIPIGHTFQTYPSRFSMHPLLSPIRATFPVHLIYLGLVNLVTPFFNVLLTVHLALISVK
jgi:hypothetical protein